MGDAVRLENAVVIELLLADKAVVVVDQAGPARGAAFHGGPRHDGHLVDAAHNAVTISDAKFAKVVPTLKGALKISGNSKSLSRSQAE